MPVDITSADLLQNIIEEQQSLTTPHEQYVQKMVMTWAALRESDTEFLKREIGWPATRMYIVDPLPQRICEAFADLLFGEDPVVTAAETVMLKEQEKIQREEEKAKQKALEAQQQNPSPTGPPGTPPEGAPTTGAQHEEPTQGAVAKERAIDAVADAGEGPGARSAADDAKVEDTDQGRLEALLEANDFAGEARAAEEVCSSEGEVWWRIYVDEAQSDYPILQWYSRSHVRPLFRGRRLVAVAFYEDIHREEIAGGEYEVYRWVGIYSEGHVRNLLYKGTVAQLGTSVDLKQRPETEFVKKEWNHGFAMLSGRIPNKLGRDRRYGISDFSGVKDLVLSLNEATSVGHENLRLTAKKRAVVPASSIREDGTFDAGEDVLIGDELDTELGKSSPTFTVLEYSFDAQGLITYKEDVINAILTRVGLVQGFVAAAGSHLSRGDVAVSGTALRLRLIPTTLAANGKARFWDDALPKMLMLLQLIDQDYFTRGWNMAAEPPAVERGEPLPSDETEETNRHAAAVGAEIESRWQAIRALNPDWTDEQVDEEFAQIKEEAKELAPPPPPNMHIHPGEPGSAPLLGDQMDTGNGNPPDQQPPTPPPPGGNA